MAAVSGAMGIILAVPLLAIGVILVDKLYVKKIHHIPIKEGKPVTVKGMTTEE